MNDSSTTIYALAYAIKLERLAQRPSNYPVTLRTATGPVVLQPGLVREAVRTLRFRRGVVRAK